MWKKSNPFHIMVWYFKTIIITLVFCYAVSEACDVSSGLALQIFFNQASGKRPNDIGDMKLCKNNSTLNFVMLTTVAPSLALGLCGPKECNLSDWYNISAIILDQFFHVSLNFSIYVPDDINNQPLDAGAIVMITICWLVVFPVIIQVGFELLDFLLPKQNVGS